MHESRTHPVRSPGSAPPRWSRVLRALREAQGATQAGWAAQLAVSRTTVQRWERGDVAPDPDMESGIIEHCRARGLLRAYHTGPLSGPPLTAEYLAQLLAEGRTGGEAPPAVPSADTSPPTSAGDGDMRPAALEPPYTSAGVPLVGRERELAALRDALVAAQAGHGRLVLLGGEAGIGKSTLCDAIATVAVALGVRALWGRCWEGEGAPSLWPWMQVIAEYLRDQPPERLRAELGADAAEIAQMLPEVRALVPDVPPPPPADPEAARFRLFGSVAALLGRLAAGQPLLVVLEDLHWADAASLRLLQFVAQRMGEQRLMLLGTYRDVEVDRHHPLTDVLAALRRISVATRLSVAGLAQGDVAALVSALVEAGSEGQPDALSAALHRETGGNPLFVREFVQHLAESGTAGAFAGNAAGGGPLDLGIPAGVGDVIGGRLARVSAPCQETLAIAAVVGQVFSHDLLARITEQRTDLPSGDALLDALDEAEEARLVVPLNRAGGYRFAHALIRDALYDRLASGRRARLHGWVGEALEERTSSHGAEHAAALAHHFGAAATLPRTYAVRALRYAELAARQAEAATAWDDAARHYQRCLDLTAEWGGALEADEPGLLLALGRCLRNAARWGAVDGIFARAIAAYKARGDAIGVAQAALEALLLDVSPGRRAALTEEALEVLGDREPRLEALLLARRLANEPLTEETDAAAQRAAELAQRYEVPEVAALLEGREAGRAFMVGRSAEAVQLYERAHAALAALGRTTVAARMLMFGTAAALAGGDLDAGAAVATRGLAYARSVNAQFYEQQVLYAAAGVAVARGDGDGFAALLNSTTGEVFPAAYQRSRLAEQRGDLDGALELLPSIESAFGIPFAQAMVYGGRARVLRHAGRVEDAKRELEACIAAVGAIVNRTLFASGALLGYAEADDVLPELAGVAAVSAVYEELMRWTHIRYAPWSAVGVDRLRGALALRLGLMADAARHFHDGLAWAERERCWVEAGRCLLALGQCAGDAGEARAYLDRAALIFDRAGAGFYLQQVRDALPA